MLDQVLSPADADRAKHTFQKLVRHDWSTWALTGGIAREIARFARLLLTNFAEAKIRCILTLKLT